MIQSINHTGVRLSLDIVVIKITITRVNNEKKKSHRDEFIKIANEQKKMNVY